MNSVFIWIPKTAGTSVFDVLSKNGFVKIKFGREIIDSGGIDHLKFREDNNVTFGHASIKCLIDLGVLDQEYYDSCFVFTFVRNPYDRFVSLWKYTNLLKRFRNLRNKGKNQFPLTEFKQFLDMTYDNFSNMTPIGLYNAYKNSRLNPQTNWLSKGVDYIGRFETLQKDFDVICSHLGIRENTLPKLNASRDRRFYKDMYTDKDMYRKVTEMYRWDFEQLGYEVMYE